MCDEMFETNNQNFDLDEDLFNSFQHNNKSTNVNRNTIFVKPQQIVKRKFPGPAGILPDCNNLDLSVLYENNDNQIKSDEIPCSQSSLSAFQDDVWMQAVNDYKQLINDYSINWIKHCANLNRLINQKGPFLAAIIQNLEYFEEKASIVNVLLKDPTGTIQATMIDKIYEKYVDDLIVGSVIILKQFSVLTTTGCNNNHYLTITPKNMVGIYSKNDSNNIRKIIINQLEMNEFNRNELANITNTNNNQLTTIMNDFDNSAIWDDVFNGVDTDTLFDEFVVVE